MVPIKVDEIRHGKTAGMDVKKFSLLFGLVIKAIDNHGTMMTGVLSRS